MFDRKELRRMLLARGGEQEELFIASRQARRDTWGDVAILRGVIEVTNVCRVNCDYCPMRRDNLRDNDRYFIEPAELLERAAAIKDCGIDVVLLQGGETPALLPLMEEVLPQIRNLFESQVEILLNIGNLKRSQYARLRDLGATSYILKHETSDPVLHRRIRHQSLDERIRCLNDLHELGFRVGTGLISSLPGQGIESIIDDIELAGELKADMCSVSPFIPAPDTPMQIAPIGDNELALNIIACLRLTYPHLLIPSVSALERAEGGGQSRGLNAGANVMTVNFSGAEDQKRYLIYGKDRYIVKLDHVKQIATAAGLTLRGSSFIEKAVAPR
jgi:biotin synthase